MGGWPELHARESLDPKKFLDDYINSYVEKDIVLAAGSANFWIFQVSVMMLALTPRPSKNGFLY
ncbi:MAG: hypothetical protein A2Z20_02805 [Bdellovibrionales bacterium RBG_16_40_8]|nr:MAG: hypothetical protein A2Z20_02805 [Bdellovibrionales bacterium RBG_16_40_8]